MQYTADVGVIGAGHAGIEVALACARLGLDTVLFTINLDAGATVADKTQSTIRFTMPDTGNVTAKATFTAIGGSSSGTKRETSVTAKAGELVRVAIPAGKNADG